MTTTILGEPLATADDVATALGITRAQVLKLRRTGQLPAINVSAGTKPTYRWRRSTIDTFLRNRRATS